MPIPEMTDDQPTHQQTTKFECAALRQGTAGGNDPADCDWPDCGCDEVQPANPQATRDALTDHEQSLRSAAERVLGCWTIFERSNGVLGADGLRLAIKELTKVCDSYE